MRQHSEGVFIENSRWVCTGRGESVAQTWISISFFLHGDRIGRREMTGPRKRRATKRVRWPWSGVIVRVRERVVRVARREAGPCFRVK
jgi:hypothetical protein